MRRILERLAAWLWPPPEELDVEIDLEDEDDDEDDESGVGAELHERLIQHALNRPLVGLCTDPSRGWFFAWIETIAPDYIEYRPFDVYTCRAGALYTLPLSSIHEVCIDDLELQRSWCKLMYAMPAVGEEEQADDDE